MVFFAILPAIRLSGIFWASIFYSMKQFLWVLILLPWAALAQQPAPGSAWQQLFNGKDLSGWRPKIRHYNLDSNYGQTFRVKDGLLQVRYDKAAYPAYNERFGHLFYREKFSHYRIAVEYRFVGNQVNEGPGWATRNSGIMLHGQSPESMGKDQDFPVSIEVQLLGGLGKGPRSTCNVCTPGTHIVYQGKLDTRHCINSNSKTYEGDQWVRAEVEVLGDSVIRHFVNGELVLEYLQPQVGGGNVSGHRETLFATERPLTEGYISLQSESHPIDFRKVEILNLCGCTDPAALNFKPWYVKADNATCVYKKKRKR